MKSTYPQVSSPAHTNGHAARWQLEQAQQRIAQLEADYLKERQRADEWRQLFIMAAALSLFLLGALLVTGW